MNAGWLALALAAVLLGIGGYAALVMARSRRLERRIKELESDSNRSA